MPSGGRNGVYSPLGGSDSGPSALATDGHPIQATDRREALIRSGAAPADFGLVARQAGIAGRELERSVPAVPTLASVDQERGRNVTPAAGGLDRVEL